MGNTWLANLTYPALTDSPNGPAAFQELADDVDRELYRPFPCTSSTRPSDPRLRTATCIYEADTGKVYLWNGDDWVLAYDTALSGGGTPDGGCGRWHHTTTQNVGTAAAIMAVDTEDVATTVVTKQTQGGGHKFVLNEAGIYTVSGNLLYATGTLGTRYISVRDTALAVIYDEMWMNESTTCIVKVGFTDRFAAGAELVVASAQSGQTNLSGTLSRFRISKVAS